MRLLDFVLDLVIAIGLIALISPNEGFDGVIAMAPAKRAIWMCELDIAKTDFLVVRVYLPDRVPIERFRQVQDHVTTLSNRSDIVGGFFAFDPLTRTVRYQGFLDLAGRPPDRARFKAFLVGAVETADAEFPIFRRLVSGTTRCSGGGHEFRRRW